jgi:hypothetical protein
MPLVRVTPNLVAPMTMTADQLRLDIHFRHHLYAPSSAPSLLSFRGLGKRYSYLLFLTASPLASNFPPMTVARWNACVSSDDGIYYYAAISSTRTPCK